MKRPIGGPYYPVVDRLTRADLDALGLEPGSVTTPLPSLGGGAQIRGTADHTGKLTGRVRAVATGEKRPPKAGEWYLSGAIVEAYRAPNDLETAYHIARLVRTRTRTETVEELV